MILFTLSIERKNVVPGVYRPLQQLTTQTEKRNPYKYYFPQLTHDGLGVPTYRPPSSQNNVQRLLLTTQKDRTTYRQPLYDRTVIPQAVFRTESTDTLKTEASPYFIQNTALDTANVQNAEQKHQLHFQRKMAEARQLVQLRSKVPIVTGNEIQQNVFKGTLGSQSFLGKPLSPSAKSLSYVIQQGVFAKNLAAPTRQMRATYQPVRALYKQFEAGKTNRYATGSHYTDVYPLYYMHEPNNIERRNKVLDQKLLLKDDGSFLEARPSYDKSTMTLTVFESVVPKTSHSSMARSQIAGYKKNIPVSYQKNVVSNTNAYLAAQSVAPPNMNEHTLQSSKVVSNIYHNWRPSYSPLIFQSVKPETRASAFARTSAENRQKAKEVPQYNNNYVKNLQRTWSRSPNYAKSVIPTASNLFNKHANNTLDTASAVSANRNVDSDEVTAENLATIFSEIDSDAIEAISSVNPLVRKDQIASNNIQMIVTKSTGNAPFRYGSTDNQIQQPQVAGQVEPKESVNLEQMYRLPPVFESNDMQEPYIKRTNIPSPTSPTRPRFSLDRLRFGLRNGNYVR